VPFEALAKQGVPFEALAKQGVPFEALARKGAPFEALAKKGDLSRWATQGVLLLNATLTVKASMPGSHQGQGWEEFTDAAVKALSQKKEHLVFMLWGNYAKNKGAHIDRSKHLVLEAAHPSPFSAHNGFFGCNHFKLANEYLKANGRPQIDWL
jgi:uracil-DNA glycosylase